MGGGGGVPEVDVGEMAGPRGGGGGHGEEEVAARGGGGEEVADEGRVDEAGNYEREAYKGEVFSRRELRGTKLISREHEFNSYGMVYVQIKPNYD